MAIADARAASRVAVGYANVVKNRARRGTPRADATEEIINVAHHRRERGRDPLRARCPHGMSDAGAVGNDV
jgi:hypothetical protein